MSGIEKVKRAVEARNPGYSVVQMTDLRGLDERVTDGLMVSVVNAGPPITSPDQWSELNAIEESSK